MADDTPVLGDLMDVLFQSQRAEGGVVDHLTYTCIVTYIYTQRERECVCVCEKKTSLTHVIVAMIKTKEKKEKRRVTRVIRITSIALNSL